MKSSVPILMLLAVVSTEAVAQSQFLVAPSSAATMDAPSHLWLPGASTALRQQTLVGPSHLTAIVGHAIIAIEFRRSAANETFLGGTANLAVTLSISPRDPLSAARTFAPNIGPGARLCFTGAVSLPTSPPELGPAVPWSPQNTVRIALQQPFAYSGGTLCVDITGTTVAGQIAPWWMADAAFEDIGGTAVDIGAGCGPRTNAHGQWSFASERSLLAGSSAELSAYGPAGSFGLAVLGDPSPLPTPLATLGLGSPGCNAYLASIAQVALVPFVPLNHPLLAGLGGCADLYVPIPNQAWVLGASTAVQWLELSQFHSSNAIRITVGPSVPTLDMALLDGIPTDPEASLSVHMAHVMRFQFQ